MRKGPAKATASSSRRLRIRLRRARHLVAYWRDGRLIIENYRSGARVAAAPRTIELLDFFDRWRHPSELASVFPDAARDDLAEAVGALVTRRLLDVASSRSRSRDAPDGWDAWDPAAGLLHFSSKDLTYRDAARVRRLLRSQARREPMPAVTRHRTGAAVPLPPPRATGEFPRVVLDRRTWRQFAGRAVALEDLSTLLGLSAGIRHWVTVDGVGRVPLKTYPSGGAQHPLELYVVARTVRGLPPGIYHYAADTHRLTRIKRGATATQIARYVPQQAWYGRAAALFLITAVFARTQWKYRFARAYRVVTAEAGHLCQNVCLTATWLGLAPFCTMALADSLIERDLGIDGISEGIVYAAGVGTRPSGVEWAAWPTRRKARRTPGPLARY